MTGGLLELWTAFACCRRCVLLNEKYSPSAEKARARPPLPLFASAQTNIITEKLKPGLLKQAIHSCVCVCWSSCISRRISSDLHVLPQRREFTFNYYYDLCLLVRLGILSPAHIHTHTHRLITCSKCQRCWEREGELELVFGFARRPKHQLYIKSPITIHFVHTIAHGGRDGPDRTLHPLHSLFPRAACSVDPSKGFCILWVSRREKCETQNGIFNSVSFSCNLSVF